MPIVSRERREFLRIEETELARSIQLTPSPGRMAAEDPLRDEPLVSVEFEVFGKVQGVYFPKYVRDISQQLGICGWVKNTKSGTILGKMQGPRALVDQMSEWLTKVGSPGSEIHHCELTNWEGVSRLQYKGFVIRF